MIDYTQLPKIMIAPNGARRTKKDHPALPISISETTAAAIACQKAGADGLHMHIRAKDDTHTLDPGLYLEALQEMEHVLPDFYVQITTEAVGQYSPQEQREVVRKVMPKAVSISVAEMLSEGEDIEAKRFYSWCAENEISVQHIIYDTDDLARIEKLSLLNDAQTTQLLFVLGRYTKNQQSSPDDLDPFYKWATQQDAIIDWAICAFGQGETDCLLNAHKKGGKVRIGFENSLWNRDGSIAKSNAERVLEFVSNQ
ncbi:MAG: 3-keto-5-aminohexanoate cleavage protein [Lentilitoribacter sp.]